MAGFQKQDNVDSPMEQDDAADYVIGDKECTPFIIAKLLEKDSKALEKVWALTKALGSPPGKIFDWNHKDKNDDGYSKNDLFCNILEEWKSRKSSDAKLSILIKILRTEEINDCADKLQDIINSSLK